MDATGWQASRSKPCRRHTVSELSVRRISGKKDIENAGEGWEITGVVQTDQKGDMNKYFHGTCICVRSPTQTLLKRKKNERTFKKSGLFDYFTTVCC